MDQIRKNLNILNFSLMSIGYLWLWCFNRNPHVLIKFITMQAYFLTWLYFLLLVLKRDNILGYSMQRLFELCFVLQLVVTPAYWALIHGPMVRSGRFPQYQVMWNVYVHVAPIVVLIADYAVNKRNFTNNWKDTAIFYYTFALPINLIYSHFQRPVYKFLLYDDMQDYIVIFGLGAVIILMQQICYHFLKGWNRKTQEIRVNKQKQAQKLGGNKLKV